MSRINLDLDDLTPTALKRLVKQLLAASDDEEQKIVSRLGKRRGDKSPKNDLADLHEEKHGRPNTPTVEDDGPRDGEEMPDIPKKKVKNGQSI